MITEVMAYLKFRNRNFEAYNSNDVFYWCVLLDAKGRLQISAEVPVAEPSDPTLAEPQFPTISVLSLVIQSRIWR